MMTMAFRYEDHERGSLVLTGKLKLRFKIAFVISANGYAGSKIEIFQTIAEFQEEKDANSFVSVVRQGNLDKQFIVIDDCAREAIKDIRNRNDK
jgi:hypothetical protein